MHHQESTLCNKQKLIDALQNPDLYDYPVKSFSVIETHISWIILTGKYAYKIKKPVDYGFIDFTTLDKRKFFCEEELRLNRRFSSDLYLQTIAIRGSHSMPQLSGNGEIIEYAVKMREFPQHCLLSNYAAEKRLKTDHIDSMAQVISKFHRQAHCVATGSALGSAVTIGRWSDENFQQIENAIPEVQLPGYFIQLKTWSQEKLDSLRTIIDQRQPYGFVRECHGDLHLGNIVFLNDKCTAFDCIEFNQELRWIDTMSEVAFVVMDLQARGYDEFAWRFLNRYLVISGDYSGLALLPYYVAYRALVRAKVEALGFFSHRTKNNSDQLKLSLSLHYLDIARSWSNLEQPILIAMHGLSGSGKSTVAENLASTLGAIQIRSDIERKRLFNLDATSNSASSIGCGIYSKDVSQQTYDRLVEIADKLLSNGFSVIVDAACLGFSQRALFRQLAFKLQLPFFLISCEASEKELQQRITQRLERGADASEANHEVLANQLKTQQPLSGNERRNPNTLFCDQPQLSSEQLNLISVSRAHG